MSRIPEHIIDQVQQATDIVALVQSYFPLKRAGINYKATCPFHSEKTPSFVVSPVKQIYHCFGCGAGGNVFHFLTNMEKISFFEAVKDLAQKAGIALPQMETHQQDSFKKTYYDLYECAVLFYQQMLLKNKGPYTYLTQRGLQPKTIKDFQIGYAPNTWTALMEYLQKKGFTLSQLQKAGLAVEGKGKVYDRFMHRVMFPISDVKGRVVAFGGRTLQEDRPPKYLNSPETEFFKKGNLLYGLSLTKNDIIRSKRVLVLEGYMDVIGLYQAGFKNGAATLGTALTLDHVQVLTRFAEEIIISYDGDKAGEEASLRGIDLFIRSGAKVKVLVLPEGFDPDQFVLEKGVPAFEKLIEEAPYYLEYKLDKLCEKYNPKTPYGQRDIAQSMLVTLNKVEDELLKRAWMKRLAQRLNMSEGLFEKFLKEPPKLHEPLPKPQKLDLLSIESELLRYLIEKPEFAEIAFKELKPSDLQHPWVVTCFQKIQQLCETGDWKDVSTLLCEGEDAELVSYLTALLVQPVEWKDEKNFRRILDRIQSKSLERQLKELSQQLAQSEQAQEDMSALLQQILEKRKALEKLTQNTLGVI